MPNNLYITGTEARSGKSVVSLGIMEMLLRKIERVGFFRPIISNVPESGAMDNDIDLIRTHFNLPVPYDHMYGYTTSEVNKLLSVGKEEEVIEGIINKYEQLAKSCDFILCEGTDFASSSAAFEFDVNAEISRNLGCSVLLVANGNKRRVDETIQAIVLTQANPTFPVVVYQTLVGSKGMVHLVTAGGVAMALPAVVFTLIIRKYILRLWGGVTA